MPRGLGAIAGVLVIMCGGEPEAFGKLEKHVAMRGSSWELVGPSGSGSVTKLAK